MDYIILAVIAALGIGGGIFLLWEAKRYRLRRKPMTDTCWDNAYEALGVPDAAGMKFKAGIAMEIREILALKGMSNQEAANLIGISEPDLAGILRGKFRDLSIDELFMYQEILRRSSPKNE